MGEVGNVQQSGALAYCAGNVTYCTRDHRGPRSRQPGLLLGDCSKTRTVFFLTVFLCGRCPQHFLPLPVLTAVTFLIFSLLLSSPSPVTRPGYT